MGTGTREVESMSHDECEHLDPRRRDVFGSYCGSCGKQLGWSGVTYTDLPRTPLAGRDCSPSHDYPPISLCSDEPCQEWLQRTSQPRQCDSGHAHDSHYTLSTSDGIPYLCEGRMWCQPHYFSPASLSALPPTQPGRPQGSSTGP